MADQLRRAFDKLRRTSEERDYIRGRLGKPDGDGTYTVRVSNRPGWAYVRIGADANQGIVIALNTGVPYRANLPVKMKRAGDLGNLYIVGVDERRIEQFSGSNTTTISVGPHTHQIGSGLEYEIEALRMEPGRVRYDSGLTIFINPFRYVYNGSWETWIGGYLDLTSYQPSTSGNWAWVLVGVDPSDNTATAVTGTEYSYSTPLTIDLIDDIDFLDYIPCAAIAIREDDTALNNIRHYQDAHGWFNTGGSTSSFIVNSIMTDADGNIMVDADGNVMIESN